MVAEHSQPTHHPDARRAAERPLEAVPHLMRLVSSPPELGRGLNLLPATLREGAAAPAPDGGERGI